MILTISFTTLGLLLFTLQIAHQKWKRFGQEFQADFGTCEKVFPTKWQGEYLEKRVTRPRKVIFNTNARPLAPADTQTPTQDGQS